MVESCPDDFEDVATITGPAGTLNMCIGLDTGADITILSNADATNLGIIPIGTMPIYQAGGEEDFYYGYATIQVGLHPPGEFPVIWKEGGKITVIGKDVIRQLGLLVRGD
jgi:predicted aspartyl protease